jgi:hypothetical protein
MRRVHRGGKQPIRPPTLPPPAAQVLLYLHDTEEGGETAFPDSDAWLHPQVPSWAAQHPGFRSSLCVAGRARSVPRPAKPPHGHGEGSAPEAALPAAAALARSWLLAWAPSPTAHAIT